MLENIGESLPKPSDAVEAAEELLRKAQPEAEAKVWGEEEWKKQWQTEQTSPEHQQAKEMLRREHQVLQGQCDALRGRLNAFETHSIIGRALRIRRKALSLFSGPNLVARGEQQDSR